MRTRIKSRLQITCALGALGIAAGLMIPLKAQDERPAGMSIAEPVFKVTQSRSRIKLVERFAKVIELDDGISRVDGFDPEVIAVTPLTSRKIRIQAMATGITNLVLVDHKDNIYELEIFVTGDVRHLQAYLDQLFPHASVEAVEVRDSVVLRGWVTQPENITEMVDVATQFYPEVLNQLKVGGVQQVLLRVKVMEVQRSKLRRLGMNLLYLNTNGFASTSPGNITPLSALTAPVGGPVAAAFSSVTDPQVSFGVLDAKQSFQGFVEALREEGLLKIRAEPALVTTNGRPATMLNGGEIPILVPQGLGTVAIEWREFGVRLEAVPIILGGGRVRLELQPEVSERDFTNQVNASGLNVPGFTVRRANTQVEMKFGETLMIAGLISMRESATMEKVPLLGEIPYLSTVFSRKRYEEVETELVILVTPEFVAPLDPKQVPPGGPGMFTDTPVDRELWNGTVEVPNYGERCADCPPTRSMPYSGQSIPTPISSRVRPSIPPMPDAGPSSHGRPALIRPRDGLSTPPAPVDAVNPAPTRLISPNRINSPPAVPPALNEDQGRFNPRPTRFPSDRPIGVSQPVAFERPVAGSRISGGPRFAEPVSRVQANSGGPTPARQRSTQSPKRRRQRPGLIAP